MMSEISLIAVISEALHQGDSLTFRKNPLCHLDLSCPEAQDISMILFKYISGKGSCSYSLHFDMRIVKDQDIFIVNGLKSLLKTLRKAKVKGLKNQRMPVEVVFFEVLGMIKKWRKYEPICEYDYDEFLGGMLNRDGESKEETIEGVTRDFLVRVIDAVFLQQGEING